MALRVPTVVSRRLPTNTTVFDRLLDAAPGDVNLAPFVHGVAGTGHLFVFSAHCGSRPTSPLADPYGPH